MSERRMEKTNGKGKTIAARRKGKKKRTKIESRSRSGVRALFLVSSFAFDSHSSFVRVWISAHVKSAGKGGPLIVERSTSGAADSEAAEFPRSSTSAALTAHVRHWNEAAPFRHSSRSSPARLECAFQPSTSPLAGSPTRAAHNNAFDICVA